MNSPRFFVHRACGPIFRASPLVALAVLASMTLAIGHLGAQEQEQGVSYTTVSKAEFGGSLGTMMKLVPGAQDETRETTHIRGFLMRTDSDQTSNIMNMGEGRFTNLNHEEMTWFTYTLEEMMGSMSAAMEEARVEQEEMVEEEKEQEASFEVKVSLDRTGRTMDMGGFSAEQFLITLEMVPITPKAVEAARESGTIAVLTETWVTKDMPGWEELRKAQEAMATEALGSMGPDAFTSAMQQALGSDPRLQEGFERNMEVMKEMEGIAVKTVVNFVTVPTGKELDSEQVMAMADQPISSGVGEAVAGAATEAGKKAAEDAARGAVGRFTRGILGRRNREEPKEEPVPEPVQVILMRMTSLVQDIIVGPLADTLFAAPATYEETEAPWKNIGGGS